MSSSSHRARLGRAVDCFIIVSHPVQLPPLLHDAPVAIASVTLDGRVLDVTRALVDASGYAAEELRGQPFSAFIERASDGDVRGHFEALARGDRDWYHVERRYRTRSGEWRDVDLAVSLVRDSAGRPSGCLAV